MQDSKPTEEVKPDKGGSRRQDQRKNYNERPYFNKKRNHRFVYPENWREDIKQAVTLETEVLAMPKKAEILRRPDVQKLKNSIGTIEENISKNFDQVKIINKELKEINDLIRNKNSGIFAELKILNKEKKGYYEQMDDLKVQKQKVGDFLNKVDENLKELSKRSYKNKLWKKESLVGIIREKEEKFNNMMKTAQEEKTMREDINKLKKGLKIIPEAEAFRKKKTENLEKMKNLKGKSNKVFEKLQALKKKIHALHMILDENKAKKDQEKKEKNKEVEQTNEGDWTKEGEDGQKKKRKKRTLTPDEEQLEARKKVFLDEISELKNQRKNLRKKFNEDYLAFEKQKFEIKKIEYTSKCKQYLTRNERKKKQAEENAKYREEEAKRAKEALQFKYQKEVGLCENLIKELLALKNKDEKKEDEFKNEKSEVKADEKMIQDENLVMMKSKKQMYAEEEQGIKPGMNKKKRRHRKKKAKVAKVENKMSINLYSLQQFDSLKIMPPTNLNAIDGVITELNEKKDYFLNLREEAIKFSEQNPLEFQKQQQKEQDYEEEGEEEEQKKVPKKNKKAKKVVINDEEFPGLN